MISENTEKKVDVVLRIRCHAAQPGQILFTVYLMFEILFYRAFICIVLNNSVILYFIILNILGIPEIHC